MTKTKRKVQLSGYWWFPNRKFELRTQKKLGETIAAMLNLAKWRWFGFHTYSQVSEKDTEGQHTFQILNPGIARGHHTYIEGHLECDTNNDEVRVYGRIGVGSIFLWGLIFVLHLVFTVFMYVITPENSGTYASSPLFVLLPMGHVILYFIAVWIRQRGFEAFLDSIQTEKAKFEQYKEA